MEQSVRVPLYQVSPHSNLIGGTYIIQIVSRFIRGAGENQSRDFPLFPDLQERFSHPNPGQQLLLYPRVYRIQRRTKKKMADDIPIAAEGMLVMTWTLNMTVFVLLVLRLAVHRRSGLKTPAIVTSDALVVVSWLFGISAIGTDAWKYSKEIQGRTRRLSEEEVALGRKVVFPINHCCSSPPPRTSS